MSLWHHRLMHASEQTMDRTISHPGTKGMHWDRKERIGICHDCPAGKARQQPVKDSSAGTLKENPGDRLHADASGKLAVSTFGGANYQHLLVENRTRMMWGKGMAHAPEAK